ncbi:hypothetical protein CPB83DRAFT_807156 [Crepidotus variabilis]|uniref:Uncharacterized protein n=1 Tax=Crepidotus variabilis TaxID=179855 RepID=A0A9P6EMS8_9AGAR|nr:hypothetical protein CPB83DRAFT_807156 [Crepidotus variabilis]
MHFLFSKPSIIGKAGWVTQLVVDLGMRRKYIATQLIQMFKSHPLFDGVTAVGLVSTHPAACDALSKYVCQKIYSIDLNFCKEYAKSIVQSSPVNYVRTMKLRGSLFQDNVSSNAACCGFTDFYVDHAEPLQALTGYKNSGNWPLGELPEGHEFLTIHPVSPTPQ